MGRTFHRIICLVADSVGVGAAADAHQYGDEGCNTLAHTAKAVGGLQLPFLQKLGIGNLGDFQGIDETDKPLAVVGRLEEKSAGKDTTTGHWELTGLKTDEPFTVFPDGFSSALINTFVNEAGLNGVLGNKAASGTEIIRELGEEHLKTQKPIIYTSADSVFQIAAHETVFGLERLYETCEIARKITLPHKVGRVIARPFLGENKESFKRTHRRRDYSIAPGRTCLNPLEEKGVAVCSVGKIEDIFSNQGITERNHTGKNIDTLEASLGYLKKYREKRAFIFANLSDFDTLYGHRRDPQGYAKCLMEMDEYLPKIIEELTESDCLIITADHGCDPTFKGTDHTRENVPLVAYCPGRKGKTLHELGAFSDVAVSVLDAFNISATEFSDLGSSFL